MAAKKKVEEKVELEVAVDVKHETVDSKGFHVFDSRANLNSYVASKEEAASLAAKIGGSFKEIK